MTSPLKRIESHPHEAKRLVGIEYDQFLALVALAEERHLKKQAEIEKHKFGLMLLMVDVNQKCHQKRGSVFV